MNVLKNIVKLLRYCKIKIKKVLKKSAFLVNIYAFIYRYYYNKETKISLGEDDTNIFYIFGRDWGECGLMAVVFYSLSHFIYAGKKGYKAIMDLQNFSWQYSQGNMLNIDNSWEYYFEQPFGYTLKEIKNSKYILYQGKPFPRITECEDVRFIWKKSENDRKKYLLFLKKYFKKYIKFNKDTKTYIENDYSQILENKKNVLGVLCRGTDYILNEPEDHPIQPDPAEALAISEKIMSERKCSYIYLATEDSKVYALFENHFGSRLLSNNQLRINPDDMIGKERLYQIQKNRRTNDAYLSGMEYLSTLYLLSRCSCFFGGITCGTISVLCMTEGFEYEYIYYKGLYQSKVVK